jgi:hypothetical protein
MDMRSPLSRCDKRVLHPVRLCFLHRNLLLSTIISLCQEVPSCRLCIRNTKITRIRSHYIDSFHKTARHSQASNVFTNNRCILGSFGAYLPLRNFNSLNEFVDCSFTPIPESPYCSKLCKGQIERNMWSHCEHECVWSGRDT